MATDDWRARYARWRRWRLETARSLTDVIVHHDGNAELVDALRSALVSIFSCPFLESPHACVDRPSFRSRRAAHEAGHPRTFRCRRCRRRHPGRLPTRYLQEI